jgi:ankyrin repeat/IBR domain-containing protein 1
MSFRNSSHNHYPNRMQGTAAAAAAVIDLTGPDEVDLTTVTTTQKQEEEEKKESATATTTSTVVTPDVVVTHKRKRRRGGKRNNSQDDDDVVILDEESSAAAFFDCDICLENNVERFRGYQLGGGCRHLFCRECMYRYIQSKLKGKDISSLVCPMASCRSAVRHADVRACTLEVGDQECWRLYQEQSTEAFLDSAVILGASHQDTTDNNSVVASQTAGGGAAAAAAAGGGGLRRCPTNHCNFTFEFQPQTNVRGHRFACPLCEHAYCLNCPVVGGRVGPAHDNSCQEVLEEMKQSEERRRKMEEWKKENVQADSRFRELLEREGQSGKTKPCPKCQTPITKNGGCNHMKCAHCKTDFNW